MEELRRNLLQSAREFYEEFLSKDPDNPRLLEKHGMAYMRLAGIETTLNDLPEFRNLSRLEWKIATGIVEGLGIKLGGSYEYNSSNTGDNNDRKYYGTLIYDF